MAKTIKFNFVLDGYPVRNLEGMEEHFSIEDIRMYYKNGLLLHWFNVRKYYIKHDAVKALTVKEVTKGIQKVHSVAQSYVKSAVETVKSKVSNFVSGLVGVFGF